LNLRPSRVGRVDAVPASGAFSNSRSSKRSTAGHVRPPRPKHDLVAAVNRFARADACPRQPLPPSMHRYGRAAGNRCCPQFLGVKLRTTPKPLRDVAIFRVYPGPGICQGPAPHGRPNHPRHYPPRRRSRGCREGNRCAFQQFMSVHQTAVLASFAGPRRARRRLDPGSPLRSGRDDIAWGIMSSRDLVGTGHPVFCHPGNARSALSGASYGERSGGAGVESNNEAQLFREGNPWAFGQSC
jgi:hypothetical protein